MSKASPSSPPSPDLLREIVKPALWLAGYALIGAITLAFIFAQTEERIAANERQALLERINTLIPQAAYDNDPLTDQITLTATVLDSADPVTVYRARKHGQPVSTIFVITSPNGYSGNIRMVVGVHADQTLAGVRVVAHKETPGLGDGIDANKSDWIQQFAGLSLNNPDSKRWAVKKDGGQFDQFTGATITPRAVVNTIRTVLDWSRVNQDTVYTLPATPLTATTDSENAS